MLFRFPNKKSIRQYTSYIKVYELISGHSLAAHPPRTWTWSSLPSRWFNCHRSFKFYRCSGLGWQGRWYHVWCLCIYAYATSCYSNLFGIQLFCLKCYAMMYPLDNEHPKVVLKSFHGPRVRYVSPLQLYHIPLLLFFFWPGDPEEFRPVFLRLWRHQHPCVRHRSGEVAWNHSGTRGETGRDSAGRSGGKDLGYGSKTSHYWNRYPPGN